jgi:S1-C subfamily serine protease
MPLRLFWLFLLCLTAFPVQAGLQETILRIKPSVVGVGTYAVNRAPRGRFQGTGFAVADGRHVVTNAHVVAKPLDVVQGEQLGVFVGQGRTPDFRKARKVAEDAEHDLALLRIEGESLPALRLGDADGIMEGRQLVFTGYPIGAVLGLYAATHRAMVSAITPSFTPARVAGELNVKLLRRAEGQHLVFQLDATSYPGNSGSPLYDPDTGEVMGIVNMTFVKGGKENVLKDPSGITYAIPSGHILELLRRAGLTAR